MTVVIDFGRVMLFNFGQLMKHSSGISVIIVPGNETFLIGDSSENIVFLISLM